MKTLLPITGTGALLETLSPHIPDEFINALASPIRGRGRRQHFSASQLWRIHLLAVLTPVHAFNLLVRMLAEQRAWRKFARLSHRHRLADVRMLHEFRDRVGVGGLRRINEKLLEPFIPKTAGDSLCVALIDATDLPASACGFKKNAPAVIRPGARRWALAR